MNPKTSTPSRWEKEAAKLVAYQQALQSGEPRAAMAFLAAVRRHRLKQSWGNMLTRCYNPKSEHYRRYGGRGITVCNQWRYNFVAFAQWALGNGFYTDLTIDREDNNGNYTPGNCRWIPWLENYKKREITEHYRANSRALLARVNRLAVLNKAAAVNGHPVISPTGEVFRSLQAASLSLGKNRNALGQAMRNGYPLAAGWRCV